MNQDLVQGMSPVILALLTFFCLSPYRKHTLQSMGLKSSFKRETIMLCYVAVLSATLSLKLWPVCMWQHSSGIWGNLLLLIERPSWDTLLNLVPFGSIRDYQSYIGYGTANLSTVIQNRVGNILAFILIGLFPSLLFRKVNWKGAVLPAFGLSMFTEIGQYFLMRYASIDDVLLNTLGAFIGYAVFLGIRKVSPKFAVSFQCRYVKSEQYR